MTIITLTTDLGTKDNYVAAIKGSILSQLEEVKIIDVSHQVDPFNIQQAAYILRNCYKDFPIGTIHIIGVDDELSMNNEHVAVEIHGHYFVGSDNGLFSILLNEMKADNILEEATISGYKIISKKVMKEKSGWRTMVLIEYKLS